MARDVLIRLSKLSANGKAPASAKVRFTPTILRADAEGYILDDYFDVIMVDGEGTAHDLPATDLNWAYKVEIKGHGAGAGLKKTYDTWYVHLPEGEGPVNFEDLPRINPQTLTPINDPDPKWVDAVTAVFNESIGTEVSERVPAIVGPLVPPLVASALSEDAGLSTTVAALASDAVTANIQGRNILEAAKPLGTADLDTITTTGNFLQASHAEATAARHYPVAYASQVIVYARPGAVVQMVFPIGNPTNIKPYIRTLAGGTWSAWDTFLLSNDLAPYMKRPELDARFIQQSRLVPNGTDLNTMVGREHEGTWLLSASATHANRPAEVTKSAVFEVAPASLGGVVATVQKVTAALDAGEIYQRVGNSGGWTEWRRVDGNGSGGSVDLTPYLTKTDASTTYATKAELEAFTPGEPVNRNAPNYGKVLTTELDGGEYDTHAAPSAVLDVTLTARSHISVETFDGTTWAPADVTNLASGTVTANAYSVGTYRIDLTGAEKIRTTVFKQDVQESTHAGTLYLDWSDPAERTLYAPTPATAETSAVMNISRFGFTPDPDAPGHVYCYAGSVIIRSTNYGATWPTEIHQHTAPSKRVSLLEDGHLLAFYGDGKVFRSTKPAAQVGLTDWELVHTAVTPGASNSNSFGFDSLGATVVYAEYGPANAVENPRRAYQSDDYGRTWRTIFEGPKNPPEGGTFHPHDVRIDPVTGWVWIVNGDTIKNSNIYHRPLETQGTGGWVALFEPFTAPSQWTTVVPMDDCVLFLSDSQHTAVWRWDRKEGGVAVEVAHSIEVRRVPETISSNPYIDRSGDRTITYFGWMTSSRNPMQVGLYGTADGRTFHELWTAPRAPLNEGSSEQFMGIYGITGVDDQGRMYLDYRDRIAGGQPGNLIRITPPTWTEAA